MYELILLRHAHTELATATMQDAVRALTSKGKEEARSLGRQLQQKGFSPQLTICSSAIRTIETAEIVAKILHCDQIKKLSELYLAEASKILEVISKIPKEKKSLIVVGHNPGLSQVCRILSPTLLSELGTCNAYCLQWQAEDWEEITTGMLVPEKSSMLYPKSE